MISSSTYPEVNLWDFGVRLRRQQELERTFMSGEQWVEEGGAATLEAPAGEHDSNGTAEALQQGPEGRVSKMDMVRDCLRQKGPGVKPKEIVAWIEERYGTVMATNMANTYKSKALTETGKAAGGVGKVKTRPATGGAKVAPKKVGRPPRVTFADSEPKKLTTATLHEEPLRDQGRSSAFTAQEIAAAQRDATKYGGPHRAGELFAALAGK